MKNVKVGFIGCGEMGNHHAKYLSGMGGIEIFAASDISEENLNSFREKYNVPHTFKDYKKIFEMEEVNGVLICLPTFLHKEPVIMAAKNGKYIFCEKPIALTLKDADEMVNTCEKNNVKFEIGFVRRFDNFWGKFRELIINGEIGRPVLWRNIAAGAAPKPPWFMDAEKGAGPFIDGCVHNYDFCRYVFGEAEKVSGMSIKLKNNSLSVDTGTVTINFKSGDQHMISWSWGLPENTTGISGNDILGPGGSIIFQGRFDEEILPPDFDSEKEGALLIYKQNGKKVERYIKNDMFYDQMVHFVQCLRENKKPAVTEIDGYKSLEIGIAVLKSFKGNSVIKM